MCCSDKFSLQVKGIELAYYRISNEYIYTHLLFSQRHYTKLFALYFTYLAHIDRNYKLIMLLSHKQVFCIRLRNKIIANYHIISIYIYLHLHTCILFISSFSSLLALPQMNSIIDLFHLLCPILLFFHMLQDPAIFSIRSTQCLSSYSLVELASFFSIGKNSCCSCYSLLLLSLSLRQIYSSLHRISENSICFESSRHCQLLDLPYSCHI